MKTSMKPSISKLVAKFDNELKNILMNDLKAVKALRGISANLKTNSLSAA